MVDPDKRSLPKRSGEIAVRNDRLKSYGRRVCVRLRVCRSVTYLTEPAMRVLLLATKSTYSKSP